VRPIAAAVLFFAASTTSVLAAPCATSPTRLCLNAGRFAVDVTWTDFQSHTGPGQAVALTGDTGYFWFFSPNNVELVVKVVDGRGFNSAFWVFYGALSNVAYTMTVTDSVSGAVKTYTNPSGTFGSVGDTSAFPSSGAGRSAHVSRRDVQASEAAAASIELALRESLLTASPSRARAAAAAPTCDATDTSLCLNGGRFRVEVSWTDFAGKTGVGTAVGLTGDTGYFWFFSSNNVELTVKVLDARVLNGRFWVFYGALSNVQYEMTVTDTLTGVVNTYSNPSGRFASVGDTEGFHAGFSVAAQYDDGRATSSVISPLGGEITATGADGTVFTLTLPEGALLSEEEITMTPVTSVGGLPLSGGLVAAVQLGPEGLQLFQAGTLVIRPPTPVAVDSEIPFAWRGSGEEFFLYPPDPLATPEITLDVFNLSGYGVGRGTPADQTAQAGRIPENEDDQLEQDIATPAEEERRTVRNGGTLGTGKASLGLRPSTKTAAQVQATQFLNHYFLVKISPKKPLTCNDAWTDFVRELRLFERKVRRLTGPDQALLAACLIYFNDLYVLEFNCFEQEYARCKANHDPSEGVKMAQLYTAILRNAPAIHVIASEIPQCLRFELKFDSTVDEPPVRNLNDATYIIRHKVSAVVSGLTFSTVFDANEGENLSATLKYEPSYTFLPGESECTYTQSGTDSVFHLAKTSLALNVFADPKAVSPIQVTYDPGAPDLHLTLSCPGSPFDFTSPRWRDIYLLHHGAEFKSPNFVAKNWTKGSGGVPFATRKYRTPSVAGVESTDIVVNHTPQ
jgi:hypothetical protein